MLRLGGALERYFFFKKKGICMSLFVSKINL
jgi:hypothetical protein